MAAAPSTADQILAVAWIGRRGERLVASDRSLKVAAVFETTFYLVDDAGGFLCVGGPDMPRGPLSAVLRDEPVQGWTDIELEPGQSAERDGRRISISGVLTLDLEQAHIWMAEPWPLAGLPIPRRRELDAIRTRFHRDSPRDSLARASIAPAEEASGLSRALLRTAALHISTLSDWIAAASDPDPIPDASLAPAIRGLLGLGAGLTPSGDDLLAGAIIALQAFGRADLARRISDQIAAAPANATSALSRAYLDCAARGEAAEPVADLLHALAVADTDRIARAVDTLTNLGHTSGWDMLAGLLAVAENLPGG